MARTIKIENTTVSSGTWMGKLLATDEVYAMTESDMFNWFRDTTVLADIDSGDLKLIKSEGPTVYYTVAEAQKIYDGHTDLLLTGGTSGQLLCTGSAGGLVWTPVVGGTIAFFNDGVTNNKWLKVGDGQVLTSDKAPVILPYDAMVYALTFTNKNNNTDVDFEIYKNGTLHYTWTLATKRWAYKTNGLSAVTFAAGDQMSVFTKSTGTFPNNPLIVIHFSFLNGNEAEGGSGTL